MSLRYRLPLTYSLIALLAALALGAVLLFILQSFYIAQETEYLEQNAVAIGELITAIGFEDGALLEEQMQILAFVTQTRIRVFDGEDVLIADSGELDDLDANISLSLLVEGDGVNQTFRQTIENDAAFESAEIFSTNTEVEIENSSVQMRSSVSGNGSQSTIVTPWSFGFASTNSSRSLQTMEQRYESFLNQNNGTIIVSDGPAFGQFIVRSVAVGLLIAGGLAVLLSALVGVFVARRITNPLAAVTATTEQMAQGDLSARSQVERADEIGRLSTSFNSMADQVEATITSLKRFAADAAHELNTPITALRTNLELATPLSTNPHYIEQADAQAERLQQLSADLLQLSQLESQTAPVAHAQLDWRQLILDSAEPIASQAEQAGLTLTYHLPDKPLWIHGNSSQLKRAAGNLLDNAIKFTPSGGEISVTLAQANNHAALTIRDTGIGFTGEQNTLFERFHRAPNAAAYKGSGLGLAIVDQIVKAHGGVVSAENLPTGAQFSISIPISAV